jgi:hypothetical protein
MVILFIVTSAINGDNLRLQETYETLESIHRRVPIASIWLLESSLEAQLIEYPRVNVIPFWGESWIKDIHDKNRDIGYLKSAIEMRTTIEALKKVPTLYSHIFKISGRYVLTDDFDLSEHPAGKATFAKRLSTPYMPEVVGTDNLLVTRLYSMCANVVPKVIECLEKAERFHHKQWDEGRVFDIEHGFHKFLARDILNETGKIGVRGRIGHLHTFVED